MLSKSNLVVTGLIVLLAGSWIANGDTADVVGQKNDALSDLQSIDLNQAMEIARTHNPRLLSARENIKVTEGERIEAGLWENPELVIYSEEIPVDDGGFSAAKNMVGLSQTIPFPGKKSLDRKASDLSVEQSLNEYLATELEVILDVKIAFYRVLASQRIVEILEELSSLSQSLATTASKRLNAGEAPAQELLRAEIEWQRAETETDKSRSELAEARQKLASALGNSELQHVVLVGELSPISGDVYNEHTHKDILQQHPSVKQAQLAVQEAEAVSNRAKKESLPDITIEAAIGSRDSEVEGSENLAEISVSFPLPLLDRGQGKKQITNGKLAGAQANLLATELELFEQFESAMSRYLTAIKRVSTYRDGILPKTDEALSLMQRGFQEGKFSFIDLLDTQRTVAETRLDYQEALFELNVADATLESMLAHDTMNKEEK